MELKILFVTKPKSNNGFSSSDLEKKAKYICMTDKVLPISKGCIFRGEKDEKKYYFEVFQITKLPFSSTTVYEMIEIGHFRTLLWESSLMLDTEIILVTDADEIDAIRFDDSLE